MGLFDKKVLSQKFDERFSKETKEVLVVTADEMTASKSRDDEYWTAMISILGYIDLENNELNEKKRYLEWEITEKQRLKSKLYNLKAGKIYQLTVRESKMFENQYTHQIMEKGRWLMVVEVNKRECHDERLERILAEYQKEVSIQPEGCESLKLDKSLCLFSGKGMWNKAECYIHIDSDGDGKETANNALKTYYELMRYCEEWDQKAREFAAKELTDLANDWAEEDGIEITNEDFMKRLEISEVCVSPDGDFELFYNDDDMFYGHVIIVSGNIEVGLDSADIAG